VKGVSVQYPMYFGAKPAIRFSNEQIIEEIDFTIVQIKSVARKLLGEAK
jgi:hypothetical protein